MLKKLCLLAFLRGVLSFWGGRSIFWEGLGGCFCVFCGVISYLFVSIFSIRNILYFVYLLGFFIFLVFGFCNFIKKFLSVVS